MVFGIKDVNKIVIHLLEVPVEGILPSVWAGLALFDAHNPIVGVYIEDVFVSVSA